VKLRVYDSIFVAARQWSMLLAGNYRCVTEDGMRTAQEAVHSDPATSKSVYDFVFDLCVKLGANPADLVRTRNTLRRRNHWCVRRRLRAPCRTVRRTSSAPISWCSSSPGERA